MAAASDRMRSDAPGRATRAAAAGRLDVAGATALAARCTGCELWQHATQTVFGIRALT